MTFGTTLVRGGTVATIITSPMRQKEQVWHILGNLLPVNEWRHVFITLCWRFIIERSSESDLYYMNVIKATSSHVKFRLRNFKFTIFKYIYGI